MFLTFGKDMNGAWIGIDEVKSGRTNLSCPYCGQRLIAKKGNLKEHHFSHDGQTCNVSQQAVLATQIPTWDTFEMLDKDEKKYIERRQKYQHDDIFSWAGMTEAMERLKTMGILLYESTTSEKLKTCVKQLNFLKGDYLDNEGKPTQKLLSLFSALSPIVDIGRCWNSHTEVTDTKIARSYHTNKLGKQKTIIALEKAQTFWLDAFSRRQVLCSPEFLELYNKKLEAINEQSLYVMKFTGAFSDDLPSSMLKIGITSRDPNDRLKEVLKIIRPFGRKIRGEVISVTNHLGRLERLLHYYFGDRNIELGQHREFFSVEIENDLVSQLSKIKAHAYEPPDKIKNLTGEKSKGGRRKKTNLELLAEYPDVVNVLKQEDGAIRKTARITNHSVNTVQKVKNAMALGI